MLDSRKVYIATHRQLAAHQREIFKRLNSDPQSASLMLVNPALALQGIGFKLSGEVIHHVLYALQHSPQLRQRRNYLEQKIKQEIQEKPRPYDPEWVSSFLFVKLNLHPLNTHGLTPKYVEPIDSYLMEQLQELRPEPRGQRYEKASVGGTVITFIPAQSRIRRLDLDATLPELKTVCIAPDSIELETLYFYKNHHPLVRDVLELGIIQKQAFPIQTADSYRQIKRGEKNNAFHAWINGVHFPANSDDKNHKSELKNPQRGSIDELDI
jgi:hypothetical protein